MSSNMQNAARASATITENVSAITAAIHQVAGAVSTTREAAKVLAR
jgi:methyl-accepting chemotaxis protein